MSAASELRDLSDDELADQIDELEGELFSLRFQDATGQLEDTSRLKEVRRDIARCKTIRRERELAATGHEESTE